jgi:ZIP family zinc transporter
VSTPQIVLLGILAGGTIFLGLPVARVKNPPRALQSFLNALATGILFFLLVDVLSESIGRVNDATPRVTGPSHPIGPFIADLSALLAGLAVGLLALVLFERHFLRGEPGSAPSGMKLGYMIATGIGLHNFSEGLAIGQSAAGGAVQLAVLLIIGFGLHNMTEGFGISAPLAGSASWRFIGFAGLIGGGPTFLGTLVGVVFSSTFVFILFLSLAGGSIIYVLSQLLPMLRRSPVMELAMTGLVVGFAVAYMTDLVLIGAGA